MQIQASLVRTSKVFLIVAAILSIPLIAMQFTSEVNWDSTDFIVAGMLLLGAGLLIDFISRKARRSATILIIAVMVILALIWAELGVGIFGSPWAGS